MKKFSNATLAAAQHPRSMARLVLVFVASVLVVLLALTGMSSGPNGSLVFAQATASPTGAAGPQIKLLNPNPSYDPHLDPTCQPAAGCEGDPPKISDRYDGSDRAYHVVAWTQGAPAGAVVEAYWQEEGENELTVGQLTLAPGSRDTWELYWDIPADWSEGSGEFVVRLYRPSGETVEQVAEHKVDAYLQHDGEYGDGDDAPAEETVEITWPTQTGQIGFHKPKGGAWRAVVDGVASGSRLTCAGTACRATGGTNRVYVYYSTAAPGAEPNYQPCGFSNTSPNAVRAPEDRAITWRHTCALAGKALPSEVTAIAAVASEVDEPSQATLLTQDSADAHRVRGYVQHPAQMKVALEGLGGGTGAAYPSSARRTAGSGCLRFRATVTDHLDRPVQGANVDVHLEGPNDQAAFGDDEVSTAASLDSAGKVPDNKAVNHSTEGRRQCDSGDVSTLEQGEHNVPGGADRKHLESVLGTGLDGGGAGHGQWNFIVYSGSAGFSQITVWVDDERIATEDAVRADDTDDRERGEARTTITAQWLQGPASVSISPAADSATVGTCNRYVVRARGGTAVMPGINVDVHANGPSDELDFCDPGDGTPRRAPDLPTGESTHTPEDEGESSHPAATAETRRVQHTEGETDAAGNFIFGIVSTVTGSTQIEAWIDGEKGQDNDVKATAEPGGTATKNWAGSAADAEVRFVNPSAYGGSGDRVSKKPDVDGNFHLVARVDLPDLVQGVDFYLGTSAGFVLIGEGTRVGGTDTWERYWDVNVADGSYTLRAQIRGTEKREDRAITVDNSDETAEITSPANASGAPVDDRSITVEGVASAGAYGVELYYTKTDARTTRNSASWIRCGTVALTRPGPPQAFQGKCEIAATDPAIDVTGIAALAYTCDSVTGCRTIESEEIGKTRQTGDAHRVYGFVANPSVTLEPAEASARTGTCQRLEVTVRDAAGRGVPRANVDVHLTGPGDAASFCDVDDGSTRRAPTSGGHTTTATGGEGAIHESQGADTHHTEGEADEGGRFVFGVRSTLEGDSQIVAWVDQNDDDELGTDEKSDTSVVHWGRGGGDRGCTITGDGGNNVIRGTSGNDVICAAAGSDVIYGRGGHDVIYGDRGRDTLRGNRGRDRLFGGGGPDALLGGPAADYLRGGAGNDRLNGGRRRDDCRGGPGRDLVSNCER